MSIKKIALVTGIRKGIGKAIASILIKNNIFVLGTTTKRNHLNKIDIFLNKKGKGFILDVSDIASIKETLKNIYLQFNSIDILVNNAGINCDRLLIRMQEIEWKKVIDINLSSAFYLCKLVIPRMIKKRSGRIIFIGSIVGSMGNIGQVNYAASKSGLIGFTKSLSREVASRGITVNIVSPGFIETSMTDNLSENKRKEILLQIPMKRFGKAYEVANIVEFLASEKAEYITGETIHVNGGLYMI